MSKGNLNGSVDLLADAMRKVFKESVEGAVKPLEDRVEKVENEVSELHKEVGATRRDIRELGTRMKAGFDDLKAR